MIEISGLRKSYRRFRKPPTVAVDHLDLSVPEGGVFGFLGPNGSGKTTTIRCILGLAHPTAGRIEVLGRPVPAGLSETMRSIGSIIESAAFLPTMSAREQVRLLAGIEGISKARADAALEEVGLAGRATDLVKSYSLGMRQRLALAVALLKDPALLVLDEPANGLDPAGMRDIRELLRRLGGEGRTVFLSSHLLSEVEQTCDRVAILSRGRCVIAAGIDDVLHRAKATWMVAVPANDLTAAADALHRDGLQTERDGSHLRVRGTTEGDNINRVLGTAGIWASDLRREGTQLEDLFLELTGAGTTESVSGAASGLGSHRSSSSAPVG